MVAQLDRIRKGMKVERSPKDKGWIMTIRVGVYDNGNIDVNGTIVNDEGDQAQGWLGAAVVAAQTIDVFRGDLKTGKIKKPEHPEVRG